MKLRDYQEDCIKAVLTAWEETAAPVPDIEISNDTLAVLPTSGGKTVVAAFLTQLIVARGGRLIYLGDTDELVEQPLRTFHQACGIYAGLEKAENRAPLSNPAVIGSLQTMSRKGRMEVFPRDHFTHIIIDEAHRNVQLHEKVRQYFESAKVLGITATDFRSDMKDLSEFYDSVCFKLGLFDMVDMGYIVPINVLSLPVVVDISKVKQSMSVEGKDYNAGEVASTLKPYYESICDAILTHATNRQIVAFLPLIESSKEFVQVCIEKGISARHIDGNSSDRSEIKMGFELKRFQLISCSQLLSVGWDCPPADCLLNLSVTRSTGLFRQRAGRVVRVLPGVIDGILDPEERKVAIAASGKPNALILDLLWQTEKIGLAGAASLIMDNQEDADAMTGMVRGATDPLLLQEIASEYRKTKEDQLIDRLKAAAKKNTQLVDARALGVLYHMPELTNFEPIFERDMRPITEGQLQHLRREGVDSKTIKGFTHAHKILQEIFRRRGKKMISLPQIRKLLGMGFENIEMISREEADKMLGDMPDDIPFPFGKHKGLPLKGIGMGYWRWLDTQGWFKRQARNKEIHAYMKKKLDPELI